MNREIRFRAWTPHGRKMIDLKATTPLAIHPDLDVDGLFIPFDDDYILMQYTGLKDRNGVEIYEGDVLADGSEVKWSVSGWWAVPVNLNKHPDRLFPLNIAAEVIGNIYENPELLKS